MKKLRVVDECRLRWKWKERVSNNRIMLARLVTIARGLWQVLCYWLATKISIRGLNGASVTQKKRQSRAGQCALVRQVRTKNDD